MDQIHSHTIRQRDIEVPATSAPVSDWPCPNCGPSCRSPLNRNRKTLRVWNDGTGFTSWRCARCDTTGWKRDETMHRDAPIRARPPEPPQKDRTALARTLWRESVPLKGSLAETYLRGRGCFLDTPNLRFLPAGRYPPAMIGRFSDGAVHLTRLKEDGTGKAGTPNDKLMFGPVAGEPLVIRDRVVDDRPPTHVAICEGIEDGLSIALAVPEFAVWVAGSASMIPRLINLTVSVPRTFLAFDLDKAGLAAYRKSLKINPKLQSIRFPKYLDANTIIQQPDGVARLRDMILRRPTFHR